MEGDDRVDEYHVILLSDANLSQYHIDAETLTPLLKSDPRVHVSLILMGSLQNQAERLFRTLPPGHVFVCMESGQLPQIIKKLLMASVLVR